MASPYTGVLNPNEIYDTLVNMIISQEVFANNISDTASTLVDHFRVDGSLYGDTKLYYGTDILPVHDWLNDAEAPNLLALDRAPGPKTQSITLDVFKQIRLTLDNYLSKRAFSTEGAFSTFNSVMLAWIRETKQVYDATTFNAFIGTDESSEGKQQVEVEVGAAPTDSVELEAYNRLYAQKIAQKIADVLDDVKDIGTDYNDWGLTRSFGPDSLMIVWNNEYLNKIRKVDLPTMFHKDGLIDKFGEYSLKSRYFGTVQAAGSADGTTIRALKSGIYGDKYYKAGDLLDSGTAFGENEAYKVDPTIACKIVHKRSIPFMSAFEVGTTFFNPRSLTENHYLTFGHNTMEHLKNFPLITVRVTEA